MSHPVSDYFVSSYTFNMFKTFNQYNFPFHLSDESLPKIYTKFPTAQCVIVSLGCHRDECLFFSFSLHKLPYIATSKINVF